MSSITLIIGKNPSDSSTYIRVKSVVLRHPQRAVLLDEKLDSAAVVFDSSDLPFPQTVLPLLEKEKYIAPGVEIGWLGFPAVAEAELCFFIMSRSQTISRL
jgi:hypothetical protein